MTWLRLLFVFLFAATSTLAQGQSQVPPQYAQTPAQGGPQTGSSLTLTLAQAEATALRNNPQITIGRLRALEAQQYVREARSALLPTASLNLTGVDTESGSRWAAGALNSPLLLTRAAAGAAVSQLVTDFGRTTNIVSSSQFQAKAEDKNAAATTADITLVVDRAFYNVLETRELVKVAEQTIKARQTLVDRVSALAQAKPRSDLDLSFANVDLSRAKLLLLESQNNYQTSLATLSALLGYADEQAFDVVEPGEEIAPPTPDVLPLITQALQQRPEVAALQFQVALLTSPAQFLFRGSTRRGLRCFLMEQEGQWPKSDSCPLLAWRWKWPHRFCLLTARASANISSPSRSCWRCCA